MIIVESSQATEYIYRLRNTLESGMINAITANTIAVYCKALHVNNGKQFSENINNYCKKIMALNPTFDKKEIISCGKDILQALSNYIYPRIGGLRKPYIDRDLASYKFHNPITFKTKIVLKFLVNEPFEPEYRPPSGKDAIPIQDYIQDRYSGEISALIDRKLVYRDNDTLKLTFLGEIFSHNKLYSPNDFYIGVPSLKPNVDLYPYQKEGVKWLLEQNSNVTSGVQSYALLGDDMGLGKTRQIIGYISSRLPPATTNVTATTYTCKFLVVVPGILIDQWVDKFSHIVNNAKLYNFKEFSPEGNLKQFWRIMQEYDVVLASYYHVREHFADIFGYIDWDAIIADEVDFLKDLKSESLQALINLTAKFRIGVTGTPIRKEINDLYGIFTFLTGDAKFRTRKSVDDQGKLLEYANRKTLRRLITDQNLPFKLPTLNVQNFSILLAKKKIPLLRLDMSQDHYYKHLVRCYKEEIEENEDKDPFPINSKYEKFLQQTCSHPLINNKENQLFRFDEKTNTFIQESSKQPISLNDMISWSSKVTETVNIIDNVLTQSRDEKIIIFVHWVKSGLLLQKIIECKFPQIHPPEFIYGKSGTDEDKNIILDNFKNKPDYRILIANINTAGFGLDLQAANHGIHFDKRWSWATTLQATRRLYRAGQQRAVYIYQFVCRHTIEKRMQNRMEEKKELLNLIEGTAMPQK
ncbi:MAG: hypothetical protein GF364_09035 [Candidatus Lokiarchaeota archaeon]|nr:hypothetical protein [Candidatus Lokiarchaeota archaeon]